MGSATFPCADCGDDITVSGMNNKRCASTAAYREKRGDICYECEKRRQTASAVEYTAGQGLPALEGTERQIAYAETLRAQRLRWLRDDYENPAARTRRSPKDQADHDALADVVATVTSAKWFIESKGDSAQQMARELIGDPVDTVKQAAAAEMTVRPAESTTSVVCEVRATSERLTARMPERHEAFNDRLKALGYRWDRPSRVWSLALDATTGDSSDRVVELAHASLGAGVPVRVADVSLHDRIVAGDYTPRTHLWVQHLVASDTLLITMPYGHGAYDTARSLPGARYSKERGGITVPTRSAAPLLDFVEGHAFRLTPGAQSAIDQSLAALARAEIVEAQERQATPDKPAERVASGEIDESLRDDA